MKQRWMKPLLWLQAFVIVALTAALAYFARDQISGLQRSTGAEVAAPQQVADAQRNSVHVAEAARVASGIETSVAAADTLHPYRELFGSVVNLQPLIQWRGQLQAAAAEQEVARAATTRAESELQRMQTLYGDERNVSQRALQIAESDQASAHAHFAAATAAAENLQLQLRQAWGVTLATWLSKDPPGGEMAQLLQGHDVLVQIADAGTGTGSPASTIEVRLPGSSVRACQARFVSPAAQAEPGSISMAYFYRCAGLALPVGARIQARLPLAGEGRRGVRVPGSALVWHGGKPWIYLQREGDRFERVDVTGTEAVGGDWFIPDLAAGSRVVTAGAQILLSEEMRYMIKNENED
jgi:hypothetical protein